MKLCINEKELKEYFDGLKRLVRGQPRDPEPGPCPEHSGGAEAIGAIVRNAVHAELFSPEFAQLLRETRSDNCDDPSFGDVLKQFLTQTVELGTEAGSVVGELVEVGEDYAVVLEPIGTTVIIAFNQINSVQAV